MGRTTITVALERVASRRLAQLGEGADVQALVRSACPQHPVHRPTQHLSLHRDLSPRPRGWHLWVQLTSPPGPSLPAQ